MDVIYGIAGRPAGSLEGDGLFDTNGKQIAFLDDDFLFDMETGKCHGCYVNGVIYNVKGHAEGFSANAKPGIAKLGPSLSMLPPRLKTTGSSVKHLPDLELPAFFVKMQNGRTANSE